MTIEIFLVNEGFKTTYLHYDLETEKYYVFLNTKSNLRKLKKIEKSIKKHLMLNKISFIVNSKYKNCKKIWRANNG